MFPRKYRLKKKGDFQKAFQKGKSIATPYLVLYTILKEPPGYPRIGIAVSRKLGTAVARNRIKRRLREAIKPHLVNLKETYDIIIVARNKIKGLEFNDLEKNLVYLLKKSRVIREE